LPRKALEDIFNGYPLTLQQGKKPAWYFDVRKYNEKHYLKIHSNEVTEQEIDKYLNRWDQIEDFKGKQKTSWKEENGEDDEAGYVIAEQTRIPDIDPNFLQSVELDNLSKFGDIIILTIFTKPVTARSCY
jgi:hypothetical protein